MLIHGLGRVAEQERTGAELVMELSKGLRDQLCKRLANAQLLRREKLRVLGILPRTVWSSVDVARERELRQTLTATLVHGIAAEPRTAALIALLHAVGRVHHYAPTGAASAREARRRASEIAKSDWPAAAVREVTTVYARTGRAVSRFTSGLAKSAITASDVG